MSSDGWNCSGPAPSQRRAPLMSTPTPGTFTSDEQHERQPEQRRRQARQELEAAAREELQHDEPDDRERDVLDEVHRAAALALEQRPRRRRAVDHDRARGQQAERRGQQEVVLDRLGLALGLRRGLRASLCSDGHCLGRSTPGARTLAAQGERPPALDGALDPRMDGWPTPRTAGSTLIFATGTTGHTSTVETTTHLTEEVPACPKMAHARWGPRPWCGDMLARARRGLSYANVVGTLALFIALGGVSYAAVKLPARSVGTKQLKTGAVTSAKVRNGTLRQQRLRRRPASARGERRRRRRRRRRQARRQRSAGTEGRARRPGAQGGLGPRRRARAGRAGGAGRPRGRRRRARARRAPPARTGPTAPPGPPARPGRWVPRDRAARPACRARPASWRPGRSRASSPPSSPRRTSGSSSATRSCSRRTPRSA